MPNNLSTYMFMSWRRYSLNSKRIGLSSINYYKQPVPDLILPLLTIFYPYVQPILLHIWNLRKISPTEHSKGVLMKSKTPKNFLRSNWQKPLSKLVKLRKAQNLWNVPFQPNRYTLALLPMHLFIQCSIIFWVNAKVRPMRSMWDLWAPSIDMNYLSTVFSSIRLVLN